MLGPVIRPMRCCGRQCAEVRPHRSARSHWEQSGVCKWEGYPGRQRACSVCDKGRNNFTGSGPEKILYQQLEPRQDDYIHDTQITVQYSCTQVLQLVEGLDA